MKKNFIEIDKDKIFNMISTMYVNDLIDYDTFKFAHELINDECKATNVFMNTI